MKITSKLENMKILFIIEDDGAGMTEVPLAAVLPDSGAGISFPV